MSQLDLNNLLVTEITERIIAIVKFGPAGFKTDGFKPGEYFQVTIDPKKISPSGAFIRFGTYQGDEINGWQRAEAISVVEVLAEWPEDIDEPLLEYGTNPFITVLKSNQTVEE